jgi:dTDP-4-dehydrorhamnose 3,5-epimerase
MDRLIPMGIEGAWLFESSKYEDARGYVREWFKPSIVRESVGRDFVVEQSNLSRSNKGVVRGIHFSTALKGQAKWVTCANGSFWDVVVDIRPESPTFGQWAGHELGHKDGNSIFISEGLGHAFVALEDDTVISYLLSSPYSPKYEFAVNPKDPEIGIAWPDIPLTFSEKDANAPTLNQFIKEYSRSGGNSRNE